MIWFLGYVIIAILTAAYIYFDGNDLGPLGAIVMGIIWPFWWGFLGLVAFVLSRGK